MNTIQTVLSIEGMTCGHCAQTVRKLLAALPGVRSVDVALPDGKATVVHDGTATVAMTKSLADAGYPARVTAAR